MKTLLLVCLAFLIGCSNDKKSVQEEVRDRVNNTSSMETNCLKLGECLNVKTTLIHFNNQDLPYACNIKVDSLRHVYLYPDAKLDSFGSLGFSAFDNAVKICQLAKQNGEYSTKHLKEERALMEEWVTAREKERAKKNKKETKEHITIEEYSTK